MKVSSRTSLCTSLRNVVMLTDPLVLQDDQRLLAGISHTLLQDVTAKRETQAEDWSAYSYGELYMHQPCCPAIKEKD